MAFAKSQIAAGNELPSEGTVFISMAEGHKQLMIEPARVLCGLGFKIVSTSGTARVLREAGIEVETVRKVQEGRPNLVDFMANGDIHFIFNTPSGKGARTDEGKIRSASVAYGVPCVTTIPGCLAVVKALEVSVDNPAPTVRALQDWIAAGVADGARDHLRGG
jgi:carbamoyl-phosphate synthase large subunit